MMMQAVSQSVFKKIYLYFKFQFLRKHFIKMSEKVKKKNVSEQKTIKNKKNLFSWYITMRYINFWKSMLFFGYLFFNLAI